MLKKFLSVIILLVSMLQVSSLVESALQQELGTVVVTSNRVGEKNYKLAGNVTVITHDQIQDSNATTIYDVLKQSAALHISDNSTVKSTRIDIRGFGDTAARNVLVLVDNRRINPIDISGPDLTQIPLNSVERIEVIRGAGSVLYGDQAVGGVVNIITKKGDGKIKGRLGANYGSYDAHQTDVELHGGENAFSYYFYSNYNDKRGYRDNSDLLATDYSTRLGYEFNENFATDFKFGWHEDTQELPGGLTDAQLITKGRRGTANDADTSNTKDRYLMWTFDLQPWPEDLNYGNFIVDFHYRNRDVYDEFNGFGPFHTKRNTDTTGVTAKYVFDRNIFDRDVDFVVGVDHYDINEDILGSGDNVDDITITKDDVGLYGYLQYELFDKLFVNGGTRYYKAEYTFDQRNVIVNQSQRPDEWVSMGGAKYEYAKGSNVHMNVQQTFRFLATDEWYSTANFPGFGITPGLTLDLEQQTGTQYEMGVKHNFDDKILASVTPYYIQNNNEIFFDPVTFGNSNYDKTRRIGVEFENKIDISSFFEIDFLDELEFFNTYAYEIPQFLEGANDGKDIPMVPRHSATAGITTKVFDYYNFSLTSRYVGARYAINDVTNSTARAKPYIVLDSKVAFEHDNLEVYMGVDNITNLLYESFVSKSTFSSTKSHFPNPERNFIWGMNLKF